MSIAASVMPLSGVTRAEQDDTERRIEGKMLFLPSLDMLQLLFFSVIPVTFITVDVKTMRCEAVVWN